MTDLKTTSRNGINMPLVGFGTYQLSTEEAETSVTEALKAGYRHIDSAEGYKNEKGTGNAIKKSGIPRKEIFLTTKLFPGNTQWGVQEKTYEATIETLKNQLKELQANYVDLYLIHAPLASLRLEQWKALIEMKKQGLAKHIGVSNYNEEAINEILDAGLEKPEINQIEFHPLCARPELAQFLNQHNIEPVAYSSLAPLSTWRTAEGQGGEVLAEKKQEEQSVINEVANDLNVSEAKLLYRWGLQKGYGILTRSSKPERIRQNIEVFDFSIPDNQMQRLNALNKNQPFAWAANGLNPMESAPSLQ
ncbi:aldo/keto reductase [Aquimarina sp. U1-2]|uniref:aldo/keto reductase family protein n=1 Tax=Aquimarina sp. U1-2 TaxID=2823141 RepID=UPI001AECE780|nr:aldo/keto reductase [Aquimarina sp. U1-2]MBP2831532.1 aldo/keto reductase [Aquimarina sp. U1-2]